MMSVGLSGRLCDGHSMQAGHVSSQGDINESITIAWLAGHNDGGMFFHEAQ